MTKTKNNISKKKVQETAKKISTKEKIFETAINLFSENGYDRTSIRALAKEVGIKESSIYNHYSNKESILNSILDYFMKEMTSEEISEEESSTNLEGGLKSFYQIGSNLYKSKIKNPRMMKIMRLIFIESYHNEKFKNFLKNEMIQLPIEGWTNLFNIMKYEKLIKEDVDSKELAESYYYYGMFLLNEHFILNNDKDEEKFIDEFFIKMEKHIDLIFEAIKIEKNSNENNNS